MDFNDKIGEEGSDSELEGFLESIKSGDTKERGNAWCGLCKMFEEKNEVKEREFQKLLQPVQRCLFEFEEQQAEVKASCLTVLYYMIMFSEPQGRYLSASSIGGLVVLLSVEAQSEDFRVRSQAMLCLSEIAFLHYLSLGNHRMMVVDLIATHLSKRCVFEWMHVWLKNVFHKQGIDLNSAESIRNIKNNHPSMLYATVLGFLKEGSDPSTVSELMHMFSNVTKNSFKAEWEKLHGYGKCYFGLLKNFLLGSLGEPRMQKISSIIVAEIYIVGIPTGEWQNLEDVLRKCLKDQDDEKHMGALGVVNHISEAYLKNKRNRACKVIIEPLFEAVFNLVRRGTSFEAVETLRKMILCTPCCLDKVDSRLVYMTRLTTSILLMGRNRMRSQIQSKIMKKFIRIHKADPSHDPEVLADLEKLLREN